MASVSNRCAQCGADLPLGARFCPVDGSPAAASGPATSGQAVRAGPADARLGTVVAGRFILSSVVAEGANGRVYEASDGESAARYAVKVLHEHAAADETAVERFKREAETARAINHPNVLRVYEFGRDPNAGYYLAMELLEGETLGALLTREAPLAPARAVKLATQIAAALGAAHARGVVHRDLKPENVFVVGGDEVRLLDFGSVKRQEETGRKLTAVGTTLGSPCYMSPEQARGLATVDARADVFSLACIAYEMLTGKVAFAGDSVAQILFRILSDNATPPSFVQQALPDAVDAVFRVALAKDPGQRTSTAATFSRDLGSALGMSALPDRAESAAPTPPTLAGVPTAVWIAVAVGCGVILFGAFVFLVL